MKTYILSRRALLTGSASCFAGSLAQFSRGSTAPAQSTTHDVARAPVEVKVWSKDYWAKKGDLSLYLFRKRLGDPATDRTAKQVLFLAHGSSVSSRPSFDLSVPGHGDYSLMDKFAEYGFDVWTMDFEGYGRSPQGPGNSDIATGAEDIKVASEVILRETGQRSFFLYGESSGALRAGVFAMAEPERVDRLVLVAFTWTGKGSSTLAKRSESV